MAEEKLSFCPLDLTSLRRFSLGNDVSALGVRETIQDSWVACITCKLVITFVSRLPAGGSGFKMAKAFWPGWKYVG